MNRERHPTTTGSPLVLVTLGHRPPRHHESGRVGKGEIEEVLVEAVELTLGERHHLEQLDASGERLGTARHRPERRRASEEPTPVVVSPVQLRLDRLQQLGHVLVLVDADRRRAPRRV